MESTGEQACGSKGPNRRSQVGGRSGVGKSGAGRPAFTVSDPAASSKSAAGSAVSAPTELDAILALQAVEDPLQKKRRSVKRGRALLDNLEALKTDLIVGKVSAARLERIVALVRNAREQVDPELDAVIEEIELRALVELAKLGKYPTI